MQVLDQSALEYCHTLPRRACLLPDLDNGAGIGNRLVIKAKTLVGDFHLAGVDERFAIKTHEPRLLTSLRETLEVSEIKMHAIKHIETQLTRHENTMLQGIAYVLPILGVCRPQFFDQIARAHDKARHPLGTPCDCADIQYTFRCFNHQPDG